MRRLKRLKRLTRCELRLLLRAAIVVAIVRTALWLIPFAFVRRLVARTVAVPEQIPVERCVWAVKVTSRCLPRATCLTQALALQALLAREGRKSRVEIGVAKNTIGAFEAHAWVICENQIVMGGSGIARYERLTAWEL